MAASVQCLALSIFLVMLVYVQLSTTKPVLEGVPSSVVKSSDKIETGTSYDAIEEARQLWNNAKRLQRRLRPRRKRSLSQSGNLPPTTSTRNNELPENLNISASKYILDLYRNLTTNPAMQQTTQANTIRSLQTSKHVVPKCNQFNFSIASINSSEFILKAELHLYMKEPKPFGNQGSYLVVIKRLTKDGDGASDDPLAPNNYITSKEITPSESGWHTFKVEHSVQSWLYAGETHAAFSVHIYPSIRAYEKQESIDCSESPVEFVFTNTNSEQDPELIVYSFDPEVEKIDYQAILSSLGENPTNYLAERRKRQSSVDASPPCSLFPLNITAGDIPPKRRGEVVLHPLYYDAGICGGQCRSKFPTTQDLKHAQLVHLLLNRGTFNDRHGYTFTQCCAPVKYSSLDVLIQPAPSDASRSVYINIINNMKILECECLDVVDFTSSRR